LAPAHPGGPGKRAVKWLWWWWLQFRNESNLRSISSLIKSWLLISLLTLMLLWNPMEWITVIKFAVNGGVGNGTRCSGMKVTVDTVKMTNVYGNNTI